MTTDRNSESWPLQTPERPVAPRYSLEDSSLQRHDFFFGTNSRGERFLEYPTPTGQQYDIRAALMARGLILGGLISTTEHVGDRFWIPKEARPVQYGAAARTEGTYSYNDAKLFSDLGRMLNELSVSLGEGQVVELDGPVGKNIALVDYTHQEDRELFFVPGVEMQTVVSSEPVDLSTKYAEQLAAEFGDRFTGSQPSFMEGYQSAA